MRANFIIDCVDRMLNAETGDGVWDAAVESARQFGSRSLLVAEFDLATDTPLWIKTTMETQWMEEYVAGDYLRVDPLLYEPLNGQQNSDVFTDQKITPSRSSSEKAHALHNGLRNTGYRFLSTGGYLADHPTAVRTCTLTGGFDSEGGIERADRGEFELLRGLIATHVLGPRPGNMRDQIRIGAQLLSVRERECLSLLAEGHLTTSIAEKLGIAEVTVSKHFAHARKRLGAATREQALAIAMSAGALHL